MNDPHVTALVYRLQHAASVNYDNAEPLEYDTAAFRVTINDHEARFEMKGHHATVEEARNVIEAFIHEWEFSANLDRGPRDFELVFSSAAVEDRDPAPGVNSAQFVDAVTASDSVSMTLGHSRYPEPPTDIAMNADVEAMALRYSRYRENKDTLAGMAYFCLTVLEEAAGGRDGIPAIYGIAASIVKTLGRLTGEKGGPEARKGMGRPHDFTGKERQWIEQAVKRMIWRAAEVARDSASAQTQITMADLPPL